MHRRVTSCTRGTIVSDLPVRIKADDNRAEFSIKGGRDLLPVVVTGLTEWNYPRIWRMEKGRWTLLSHARNTDHDGYQVFCDEDGSFGAVFLVAADDREQLLKVSAGDVVSDGQKINLEIDETADGDIGLPPVAILDPQRDIKLRLLFPETDRGNGKADAAVINKRLQWKSSEGSSRWFESNERSWRRGGRLNPHQEDIDLEYWWQNSEQVMENGAPNSWSTWRVVLLRILIVNVLGF